MLIGARFIQGAGGALTSAVVLGMIVTMFPEPRDQAKAIGVYGFVASAGGSIGLLAGGVLTDLINWHWIFFVNIPVGIATAFFALRLIEPGESLGLRHGADVPGAALLTGGLMLGVYTILQVERARLGLEPHARRSARSPSRRWPPSSSASRGSTNPLMPLRLFRSRNVTGANAVQALLVVGMFGMFFLGALYLQQILGYDALEVGLAFLPSTIVMGAMSLRFSGPLADALRHAPHASSPASGLIGAGLLLFARTPVDGRYVVDVLPAMVLVGLGAGLGVPGPDDVRDVGRRRRRTPAWPPASSTPACRSAARSAWPCWRRSRASAPASLVAGGTSHAAALNSGFHLAYLIGAGVLAAAVIVALGALREPRAAEAPAAAPKRATRHNRPAYSEA